MAAQRTDSLVRPRSTITWTLGQNDPNRVTHLPRGVYRPLREVGPVDVQDLQVPEEEGGTGGIKDQEGL